jgi:membrane protease YdiL (CAAX protease family)
MTGIQDETPADVRGPRRFRYLIDIVALAAVALGLEVGLDAVYVPKTLQSQFAFGAAAQLFVVGVVWLLIRLRRERLADIGLKQPQSWLRTIVIGVVFAAMIFGAMYFAERAGFRRDLSRFKMVQGNLGLTLYGVFYAFLGAGFYEEFLFRGFLFQGLAKFFGDGRGAWIAANIGQAALFGAAHAYQNPLGMAITGTLGLLMGFLVLASGRNLWLVIVGHGLYDASRFVLFYFQGPPPV